MRKTNLWPKIEAICRKVERPSRYINHEYLAVKPNDADFGFCMAYPDTYELGQPNQALRILVNAVNATDGLAAERTFLPAVDMIELMREKHIPLFSIEGCNPVKEFDVFGVTLPHELAATNICELLDLAQIPVRAEDRTDMDPFVIAGGPCAFNPEPYAPFFDVFQIGEGEEFLPEMLLEIKRMKDAHMSRGDILRSLASMQGAYVPSLYDLVEDEETHLLCPVPRIQGVPDVIEKRVFEGFATSDAYEPMIVPYVDCVHDRLNVEVLRGCARGCRFCQAGMMYRPVRERNAENIISAVKRGLLETGYEEASLTSLSTTDHSQIKEILHSLNSEFEDKGIRVSIPSQRLDSFGVEMASEVAGKKKGGLTFAPEAGTQRLRDVINKNVTENDLMCALDAAVNAGWRRVKLYFMIGLPTETIDDAIGIAHLANAAFDQMKSSCPPDQRGSLRLNVSIGLFVPKAQTPFQWDGQLPKDEAIARVNSIKSEIKTRAIQVSYHDPKTSLLEAVLSRGDRRIADLVELAWQKGARFDAWTEFFNEEAWADAAKDLEIDIEDLAHRSYEAGTRMPFDHISTGASKEFLVSERRLADDEITTPDCTMDTCSKCGVCMSLGVSNNIAKERL